MTHGPWTNLRRELAAFADSGLRLPIWWRDDDVIEPTRQLDRLARLATESGLPVHLAIVPAHARPALGPHLNGGPFRGVVHGWAHENHAPHGRKPSEFGTPRDDAEAEAANGLRHLRALFGGAVHPMFVPPWNRVHATVVSTLPSAGYHALSTFGPRDRPLAAPDLVAINTHVDPVDWRGTRGLADPDRLLDQIAAHLRARLTGEADNAEPLGLLTHHLMMDDPTWEFCRGLIGELLNGPIELFDIAEDTA